MLAVQSSVTLLMSPSGVRVIPDLESMAGPYLLVHDAAGPLPERGQAGLPRLQLHRLPAQPDLDLQREPMGAGGPDHWGGAHGKLQQKSKEPRGKSTVGANPTANRSFPGTEKGSENRSI
ncbi:hypothetical protein NDU88_000578 [Pleurodeles waltl]|uniref:Uncharacterized protein n=1 Tax=Pleurodeles waltl TaxID=8319 RepID=A0AAV7MK39_PLEWA|nr:hypothetical protein NDU88_000578 [Pleurodeles waltl]